MKHYEIPVVFVTGLIFGAREFFMKDKYEQIVAEEIKSFKENYRPDLKVSYQDIPEENVEPEVTKEEPEQDAYISSVMEFAEKLRKNSYTNYSGYSSTENDSNLEEEEVSNGEPTIPVRRLDKPYIITPDEFEENEHDYDLVTLIFYEKDGVLVEENGDLVDDVEERIGFESLTHFGDYDDIGDCVYVQNDDREVIYEVILNEDAYISPHDRRF